MMEISRDKAVKGETGIFPQELILSGCGSGLILVSNAWGKY